MTDYRGTTSLQHSSHADLIEVVTTPSQTPGIDFGFDAIIVPASRQAKSLTTVIELAKATDCHLVVLCSLEARPQKVRSLFIAKEFTKGIAIEVPFGYSLPSLTLDTTIWMKEGRGSELCGGRRSDLSLKRNIGLLITRMLRWKRIFFVDDDIRGITVDDLACTVSLLKKGFRSAAMRVKHFPDNSVVCHARREVKEDQDVFVSGSVLAVDATEKFTFFPDIYNEDWLFFYQDVTDRRMATPSLLATQPEQMKYNPFADPQRAAKEEFGDVIAEGLYSLLHRDDGPEETAGEYWATFIAARHGILDAVRDRLDKAPPERRNEIEKAIVTARETLAEIEPDDCVEYLAAWKNDLKSWGDFRDGLSKVDTVSDALRELELLP